MISFSLFSIFIFVGDLALIQKMSILGPKPGPPRNLTVTEIPNGFLISWQVPLERAHLVQFYTIKYRTDAQWKVGILTVNVVLFNLFIFNSFQTLNRGQIRPEETQYLVKNLVGGRTYYFRVLANSVKSYESSDEVKFPVPARVKVEKTKKHKNVNSIIIFDSIFYSIKQ
jgi:immunoglobulin superfamily member 9B